MFSSDYIEAGLIGLVIGSVLGLFSLLAVWAALNRRHWVIRYSALLAAVALLLPVRAYDGAIFFMISSLFTVGVLTVARSFLGLRSASTNREARENNPLKRRTFRLIDLLLLTALLATATATTTFAVKNLFGVAWSGWIGIVENAFWSTALTVMVAWTVLVPKSLRLAVLSVALFMSTLGMALVRVADLNWASVMHIFRNSQAWALIVDIILLFVALGLWRFAAGWNANTSGKLTRSVAAARVSKVGLLRRTAGISLTIIAIFVSCPMVWVYWQMLFLPAVPNLRADGENNYTNLLEIAAKFNGINVPDEDVDSEDVFAAFIVTHGKTLEDAHDILKRPIWVPLGFAPGQWEKYFLLSNTNEARQLMRAFRAEGIVAEAERREWDATRIYMDMGRLGHATASQGLVVDYLTGIAIESAGLDSIRQVRSKLSGEQCRKLILQLKESEGEFESVRKILHRDRVWTVYVYGWPGRLDSIIGTVTGREGEFLDTLIASRRRRDAVLRLLTVELAIRAHQLEKGKIPRILEELVPEFLDQVPQDPFGSGDLIYRTHDADGYLLYSVGRNRKDDGGMIETDSGRLHKITQQRQILVLGQDYVNLQRGDYFLDHDDWYGNSPSQAGEAAPEDAPGRGDVDTKQDK